MSSWFVLQDVAGCWSGDPVLPDALSLQVKRENHTQPNRMTQHTLDKSSSWGDFPAGNSTMTSLVSTMNYCAQNKVSCLSFRGSLSYSQAGIKDVNKWCLKEWIPLKNASYFLVLRGNCPTMHSRWHSHLARRTQKWQCKLYQFTYSYELQFYKLVLCNQRQSGVS